MRLLFVYKNPSRPNQKGPFASSRTLDIFNGWLTELPIQHKDEVIVIHSHYQPGKLPSPEEADGLEMVLYNAGMADIVVSLGDFADKAMESKGISHFRLPDPSYLNKKVEDETYMSSVLNTLYVAIFIKMGVKL